MAGYEVGIPIVENPYLMYRGDPLAEALRAIRLTGVLLSNVVIGPVSWSTSVPHSEDCIILYIVTRGRCVGGALEPLEIVDLAPGDALLLPRPGRCVIAQTASVKPVPLETLLDSQLSAFDGVEEKWKSLFVRQFALGVRAESDIQWMLTSIRMFFDRKFPPTVLSALPRVVHLPEFLFKNQSLVESLLAQIGQQGGTGLSGQSTATRLAEALLVCALSSYLATAGESRPGFCRGLRDPYLAAVIGAIQESPDDDWSLPKMARTARLSRSAFADRFRSVMDMTPTSFVTTIRMAKATEMLHQGSLSIARIAELTGYGSEASFNRAFRKWCGTPPAALRRAWISSEPVSADDKSKKVAFR